MEYLVLFVMILLYPYFRSGLEELFFDIIKVLLIPVRLVILIINFIKSKIRK